MKHQAKGKKLGRKRDQHKALFKLLIASLVKHGKITTTEAKAKAIKPRIEKLITRSKRRTLANRRILIQRAGEKTAQKMMDELGPRYKDRGGGYTRIIKLSPRKGDGAFRAVIEFV